MNNISIYKVVLIFVFCFGFSSSLFADFTNEGDLYNYNVTVLGEVHYIDNVEGPKDLVIAHIGDLIDAQVVLGGLDDYAELSIPVSNIDGMDLNIVVRPDFSTGDSLSINISWITVANGYRFVVDYWRIDAMTITLTGLDWVDGGTPGIINGVTLTGTEGIAEGLVTTFADDEIIMSFYVSEINTYFNLNHREDETLDYLLDIGGPGPTPIPEPSTYLLLGSTLLIVGVAKRRHGHRLNNKC